MTLLDRAFLGVIAVGAVLWAGAARPPASLVLAAAAGLFLAVETARAWRSGRTLALPLLALPAAALCGATLLQLVPLPHGLRAALDPAGTRLVDQALDGIAAPGWRPLTPDVAATLASAAYLGGLVALAAALGRLGERRRDLLRACVVAAAAAVALVAALSALGVTLPAPLSTRGRAAVALPFVNANHAASLLALALPIALEWATRARGGLRIGLVALIVAGNVTLVATLSRAGIALGAGAQIVVLAVAVGRRLRGGRGRAVVALGALALLVGLVTFGRPLLGRLLPGGAGGGRPSRLAILREALPLVGAQPLTGVGRGAFVHAFARTSELGARNRYAFVENEFLQVPLDVGIPAALVVFGLGAYAVWRAARSLPSASTGSVAAAVGLAAVAAHNAVDFSFEAGGVAVAALAAAVLAAPGAVRALPRGAGLALCAGVLALVVLAASPLGRGSDADLEALRAVHAARIGRDAYQARAAAAFARHPADGYLAAVAAEHLLARGDARAFAWLDRALFVSPHDVLAHATAARALARAGNKRQAAVELRAALDRVRDPDRDVLLETTFALFGDGEEALVREALPEDPLTTAAAVERAARLKRARLVLALAGAAPPTAPVLRAAVEAALAEEELAGLAERARALAAVDHSPAGLRLAADALLRAGHDGEAERLLEAALASPLPDGARAELAIALANRRAAAGRLDDATAVIEDALARAVAPATKARLHLHHAELDARAGRPHRAAAERAEAARLSR